MSVAIPSTSTATSSVVRKVPKRRNERNILTFYEKIAVIRYYNETSISRNGLAKMFHCCATQIRRILERKNELLQQLTTMSEADASIILEEMTRKRRKFEMSAISFILHQWVERCRQLRLRKSITNQTLKETALKMAAILNLPAFRPSYRWLNRFRAKYKYNATDLGGYTLEAGGVAGELVAVEDIIIEFKDALPSFMQKEISAITSLNIARGVMNGEGEKKCDINQLPVVLIANSEDEEDEEEECADEDENDEFTMAQNETAAEEKSKSVFWEAELDSSNSLSANSEENTTTDDSKTGGYAINNGCSALLEGIFPHLAVIHQFALLNSDIKALELISQLGVHMQSQAAMGAYKEMAQATSIDAAQQCNGGELNASINGGIYADDIDDIVLME